MAALLSEWRCYQLSKSNEAASKNWAEALRCVATVKEETELLFVLDAIATHHLERFYDFNIFKNGIKPMWEDKANMNGGRCIYELPNTHTDLLHSAWTNTTILCTHSGIDSICGCVYNSKNSNFRIAIWIADPRDQETVMGMWRAVLPSEGSFFYSSHTRQSDYSRAKKRPGFGRK